MHRRSAIAGIIFAFKFAYIHMISRNAIAFDPKTVANGRRLINNLLTN